MQRQSQVNQPKKETLTLGDQLNDSLMQQLKVKKKELQVREEEKEAAELERAPRTKEREKNKSFEELLSESNLTWKDFK